MKTLKLDETGDLALDKADLVFVDEVEEVRQSLYLAMATNKREWFLHPDFGLDFKAIIGKPTDSQIRAAIIATISQEERVELIEDLQIKQDRQARKLSVFFRVRIRGGETIEGEVSLNAR
ncbi:DUF2634 domain-containing protein [Indiicoccus explosivorum]|uniref:contractile injection system sheath initiator n=1 Tax=Indiicoccus explosivorum TaxID=1917864 RepID=UPI000B441BAE|nr:DUF2634 domain-containing protein [Indiicoccus explosivorum]